MLSRLTYTQKAGAERWSLLVPSNRHRLIISNPLLFLEYHVKLMVLRLLLQYPILVCAPFNRASLEATTIIGGRFP